MTQTEQILEHIRERGSITPLEALKEYGIMRLASRVCDLKRQGYEIERTIETANNRFGEPVRFARYSLRGAAVETRRAKGVTHEIQT